MVQVFCDSTVTLLSIHGLVGPVFLLEVGELRTQSTIKDATGCHCFSQCPLTCTCLFVKHFLHLQMIQSTTDPLAGTDLTGGWLIYARNGPGQGIALQTFSISIVEIIRQSLWG